MAQLAQFASVMVYTGFCFYYNYKQSQLESRHVLACLIQVGEMASLFVLFYGFYKKSYSKGKGKDSKKTDVASAGVNPEKLKGDGMYKDECNVAIASSVSGELTDECAASIGSLVGSVKEVVRRSPRTRQALASRMSNVVEQTSPSVAKATAKPSWALFS